MDEFAVHLLSEVAADIVAALLIGGVVLVVGAALRRRRFRTFFGITPTKDSIKVMLSCIDVKPGGGIGTEVVTGGSQGTAINHLEYQHALRFASAVESTPFIRFLHSIEPDDWHTAKPVTCDIKVAPSCDAYNNDIKAGKKQEILNKFKEEIRDAECVVLVGGAIYNVMTKCLLELEEEERARVRVQFIRDDSKGGRPRRGIRVCVGTDEHDYFREDPVPELPRQRPKPGREYFVLGRFKREQTTVFLCAGNCTAGTVAALDMIRSWRRLQRDVGSKPFLRVYEMLIKDVEGREKEPPDPDIIQRVLAVPPST